MKFEVTGRVEKSLWNNDKSYLYKIIVGEGDKTKDWAIFCQQELALGQSYKFAGYVSTSKDKKRVTSDNKAIYNTSFNAETITQDDSFPF